MLAQLVALLGADHKLVVNVPLPLGLDRQANPLFQFCLLEKFAITIGVSPARPAELIEVSELHQQNRSLQGIQAAVHSQQVVVIFLTAAMLSQYRNALGKIGVVGGDQAAVACSS